MWQRADLKTQAKQNLNQKYWMAFLVSLILSLVSGGTNVVNFRLNPTDLQKIGSGQASFFSLFNNSRLTDLFDKIQLPEAAGGLIFGFFFIFLIVALFASSLAIAFQVLVASVIRVGGLRWFSRNRESAATPSINQVFSLFKAGSYLKTVGGMLWMGLFILLWSLLAVVPTTIALLWLILMRLSNNLGGSWSTDAFADLFANRSGAMLGAFALIVFASMLLGIPALIKRYSYQMTPWILADNPAIGYRRALKLSMQLTSGQKWAMFVLDLSFIGWFLLGVLACGIGVLFVAPYYQAVQAELYARLRQLGVERGDCTMEELGFVPVNL
jgi:uncharacterized membrane protein